MAATDPYATGETQRRVGFVLGGGGDLGANEVGMLRALLERSIVPDLVVGTSVGALNGAAVAAHPTLEMVERLETGWRQPGDERIFGLLPAVEIGGEHFIDGGIVNSIPIERALQLGATDLYVLHVGRIERPLQPPRNLFQVATVAFEIARRHRFAHDMEDLPAGIVAH